jgi:hypothetical protein
MPPPPSAGDTVMWTDTTPPPGWVAPDGYAFVNLGTCRGCDARIAWYMTRSGKRAPLDRDGASHFATCPNAERFRRSTR